MSTLLSHTIQASPTTQPAQGPAESSQPPLLSLFSSTSEPPLALFHTHTDPSHPRESLITLLPDSAAPSSSKTRVHVPRHVVKGSITHPVLHIQSPEIRTTYIQAGISLRDRTPQSLPLGIELPWLHVQLRPLGRRPLAIEVGVSDRDGTEGIIRLSNFQHEPRLHRRGRDPAVLLLPLKVPETGPTVLTPWLEVDLNLAPLLPLFRQMAQQREPTERQQEKRAKREEGPLPTANWGRVTYVRVYANCRLRRLWFTANGRRTLNDMGKAVEDFALHAAPLTDDSS